jgi:acetolactate synthase-1/3 small subunit
MRHTLSFLVEGVGGELPRIIGLLSARGFGIESLTMAPTHNTDVSRITIVTRGAGDAIEKLTSLVGKQVRVLDAVNMTGKPLIERELALIDVKAIDGPARQEVLSLASSFGAEVVDVSEEGVILQASGDWNQVNSLIELLKPMSIRGVARTGTVAISSLSQAG